LLVQDLRIANAPIVPIIEKPVASSGFTDNIGSTFYVLTDDHSPHYRMVAIDITKPAPENWRTIIPEDKAVLEDASLIGGQFIATYTRDAHSEVRRFSAEGKTLGTIELPGIGSTQGFAGHVDDQSTYYSYTSFVVPSSVYRLDLTDGRSTLWHSPKLHDFDSAQYQTKQIFYASKDGTRVPMFISARKGIPLDGSSPAILTGYGGFLFSPMPEFRTSWVVWMEMGGVFALANLRGGGEYGRKWHEGGMKLHKQNVFDDFIAAAESLIANKWTSPKRLAIWGSSNGGLLVGAVEEQRPDLFAAAVPDAGVMDMMRFREFTTGRGTEAEFGTIDNEVEFKAMLAYSPVHQVKAGVNYPATLIMTGDHDDRVYPAHSFKFAAAMQHADPDGNPILIRVETRAGHGAAGKPLSKSIEERRMRSLSQDGRSVWRSKKSGAGTSRMESRNTSNDFCVADVPTYRRLSCRVNSSVIYQ
jgi:prolyl oligopeptidase